MMQVMTKAHKRFGKVYPATATEYAVDLKDPIKGGYNQITVYRSGKEGTTFQVGDVAEYDSYNLTYTGIIDKITDKAVTIVAYKGTSMQRTHRLDLNAFCWRNYNFDAVRVAAANQETMMYI